MDGMAARDDKKKRGVAGRGRESRVCARDTRVGVTVSRRERILLLAQGHLSTSIYSLLVFSSVVHQSEREKRGRELLVYQSFEKLCVSRTGISC